MLLISSEPRFKVTIDKYLLISDLSSTWEREVKVRMIKRILFQIVLYRLINKRPLNGLVNLEDMRKKTKIVKRIKGAMSLEDCFNVTMLVHSLLGRSQPSL